MKKLSVSEYADLKQLSVKTIYKKINRGEIPHVVEGGKKYVTIDDSEYIELINKTKHSPYNVEVKNIDLGETSSVQDAEIVTDLPGDKKYNLVSMENKTFEQLIQNIKELSDRRAETDQETIKRLQEEYYESRAENKRLNQEVKELNIKLAEAEIRYRVNDLRVKELETSLEITRKKSVEYENGILEYKTKVSDLEIKINSFKKNIDDYQEKIKNLEENKKLLLKENENYNLKNKSISYSWLNKI